jgi:peptidyl-prolyl cis-trans isomerase SurA
MRALLFTLSLLFVLTSTTHAERVDGVAATVNGRVITKSDVKAQVAVQEKMLSVIYANDTAKRDSEIARVRREALDALIERELILAEFETKGGAMRPEYVEDDINNIVREQFGGDRSKFIAELTKAGLTLNRFRESREKMMVVQYMRSQLDTRMNLFKPSEVVNYYNKNDAEFREPGAVNIRTITIPKYSPEPEATLETQRKLAEEIRTKIVNGGDFAALAKAYSQDSKAPDGGAWGWVDETSIRAQYAQAARSMKPGQVTPVIEDVAAFVLVKLEDLKLGKKKPLEEVRAGIEKILRMEAGKAEQDAWVEGLKKGAVIRKF